MTENNLKLQDCTLRDGGYINNWAWGFQRAKDIIRTLVRAKIDVIEVGFLRNVNGYDTDSTVCSYIEELNRLLPGNKGQSIFQLWLCRAITTSQS